MTTSPFEDRPDGHPEDFDEDDDLEEELTFGEGASHAPAYSEFSEHESDAGRELDAVMLEFMTQGLGHKGDPAAEFIPFVDFDLDLSTVTEFTDAEGLAEEIEALERIWKQSQERNWEYMNGKREQIMRHRELAREQRRRKEEEEDNMKTRPEESSPIALQKRCTHRIARVPKVLRGAGKRLRNVARKLLVKAGHPTSHSSWRSPKSKIEGEAAIIPAKVKSGMTNRKASDCILDALTSCVRWSQPDESEVGMEKP
ncbi:hypothetical protein FA95DRAFT_1559806 [Auriscalpium vulgare]|uniref:Uncharacterized protein n=1 Tax=Auriscalpium vulgare TaxID=40419 RepID=A0ACB8RSG6_9AGAM|nr:hypothetical protein FA95DRAFT_1559806 [Auriscalpium vulgare]